MKTPFIYALFDPRSPEEFRYIGQTNPNKRKYYKNTRPEMYETRVRSGLFPNTLVYNWVKSLQAENIEYSWKVIRECQEHELDDVEIEEIAKYRALGFNLLNMTNGGKGLLGFKHSEESKKKMSMTKTGVKQALEHTKACADGHRGKKQNPESVAKRTAAITGKKRTPEQRARMKLAAQNRKRGHKQSPEQIAKRIASYKKTVELRNANRETNNQECKES
jgi:hypothetical protein